MVEKSVWRMGVKLVSGKMVDMGVMHELRSYVSHRIQSMSISSGVNVDLLKKRIVTSLLTIPQLTRGIAGIGMNDIIGKTIYVVDSMDANKDKEWLGVVKSQTDDLIVTTGGYEIHIIET